MHEAGRADLRLLARHGRRWIAPRCGAVSLRARRDELRKSGRNACLPEEAPRPRRREIPGPHAAGGGEPVAGGRGLLLRHRRRVAHEFPFPAHAADVHVAPDGGSLPDHRHHGSDAGDSRELPVGDVPPESRRVDSRNGDRRGARLHVAGLCERSDRADQSRDSPPARAAPRQQPPQDRAAEHSPLFDAWNAGPLLRRRDRDGRQRLPRRSQRRPHPDAMEPGSQRRFLARESAAALSPDHHRPRVQLRGDQRRERSRRISPRSSGGRGG